MNLETFFALSLLALSTQILYATRRKKKNKAFFQAQANRCLGHRCEVPPGSTINFDGRLHTRGIALLRNKKTGELKFIDQAKLTDIGLIT